MAAPKISESELSTAVAALEASGGNQTEAARMLGLRRSTFIHRINAARARQISSNDTRPFIAPELPSADEDLESLLARKRAISERTIKADDARVVSQFEIRGD